MTRDELMLKKNKIFRHFKGDLYMVVDIAEHTETKEELVIYRSLYGNCQLYARPIDMFLSEVDREKYPDVKQKNRLEYVELPSMKK